MPAKHPIGMGVIQDVQAQVWLWESKSCNNTYNTNGLVNQIICNPRVVWIHVFCAFLVHISCLHTCPLIQFANILSSVHMFGFIEITWFSEVRKKTHVPPFLSAFNPLCLLSYLLVGFLVQKPPRVNMTEPTGNCVAWIIWEQEIFDRNHKLLHIKCTKPLLNILYLYNIVWEDSYENIKSFWGVTGFVSVGSGNCIEAVWPWHLWY